MGLFCYFVEMNLIDFFFSFSLILVKCKKTSPMDNDEAHVAGDFFLQSTPTPTRQRKTFYEHVQRIIPLETIVYIQYCLLRIPFILMYDYLFTEHFFSSIYSFVKYSTEIIDRRNPMLFKALSYVLQSHLFQILLQMNIALIVPVLGKEKFPC